MSKRKKKNRYRKKAEAGDYMVIEDDQGVRVAVRDHHDKDTLTIRRNPNIKVICTGYYIKPERALQWAEVLSH